MHCPWPSCEIDLADTPARVACDCAYGEPIVACPGCGASCRAGADYCRRCRGLLTQLPSMPGLLHNQPDVVTLPGAWHQPPSLHRAQLWMISESGTVFRWSPFGNSLREWARIPSKQAAFNPISIPRHVGVSGPSRPPVLLVADPSGVHSVSLVTRECRRIIAPGDGGELVCNASAAESVRFSGVAAAKDFFCCLLRAPGSGQAALTIQYFSAGRAAERPATVGGQRFLGPVVDNHCIAVCGDEEIVVLDTADGFKSSLPLADFEPFFERPSSLVNIPLGGMPLAVARAEGRTEAWIGGKRGGVAGVLHVRFETQSSAFTPLPEGSAFGFRRDSGLSVNAVAELRFFERNPRQVRVAGLEKWMPVSYVEGAPAYFAKPGPGAQRSLCIAGAPPAQAVFSDRLCNEDSCCGIFSGPGFVAVSCFGSKEDSREGMTISRWSLRSGPR